MKGWTSSLTPFSSCDLERSIDPDYCGKAVRDLPPPAKQKMQMFYTVRPASVPKTSQFNAFKINSYLFYKVQSKINVKC